MTLQLVVWTIYKLTLFVQNRATKITDKPSINRKEMK